MLQLSEVLMGNAEELFESGIEKLSQLIGKDISNRNQYSCLYRAGVNMSEIAIAYALLLQPKESKRFPIMLKNTPPAIARGF